MIGKIGVFVNNLEGYQGAVVRETKEAAEREGLEVEVFDGEYSGAKLGQEVIHFQYQNVGKRLCVFVLPEADAHVGDAESDPTFHLAARVLQKQVGWITLNHGREAVVTSLKKRFPALPVALVEIDNVDFGRVQGKQVQRLLPRGGTLLCVRGNPLDTACRDRSEGMRQELRETSITISEVDARWSQEVAETLVHKWLCSPLRRTTPLGAVVAQNDQMAASARRALRACARELARPDLEAVPVLGGDGLPEIGRPWVDDGTLTATVSVTLPGRTAVEQLARHWRDGAPIDTVTRLRVESYPPLALLVPRAA